VLYQKVEIEDFDRIIRVNCRGFRATFVESEVGVGGANQQPSVKIEIGFERSLKPIFFFFVSFQFTGWIALFDPPFIFIPSRISTRPAPTLKIL